MQTSAWRLPIIGAAVVSLSACSPLTYRAERPPAAAFRAREGSVRARVEIAQTDLSAERYTIKLEAPPDARLGMIRIATGYVDECSAGTPPSLIKIDGSPRWKLSPV